MESKYPWFIPYFGTYVEIDKYTSYTISTFYLESIETLFKLIEFLFSVSVF